MEEKMISWYACECMLARDERHIRRLAAVLAITIALLFLSNFLWFTAWEKNVASGGEACEHARHFEVSSSASD